MAIPFGDFHCNGQILRDWIRQRNLTASNHVGEQKRCKDFAYRANLKDSITVQFARVIPTEVAVGDDSSTLRFDQADDYADAILLASESASPFREHLANLRVRGKSRSA